MADVASMDYFRQQYQPGNRMPKLILIGKVTQDSQLLPLFEVAVQPRANCKPSITCTATDFKDLRQTKLYSIRLC
jgi:hypothetical protein